MTKHQVSYGTEEGWPSANWIRALKARYRELKVSKRIMLWEKFPMNHAWLDAHLPEAGFWRGRWRSRIASPADDLTFEATLESLEVETFVNSNVLVNRKRINRPKGVPVPRKEMWQGWSSKDDYLIHTFVASFTKANEHLFSISNIEIYLRGEPAVILLDKAVEVGCEAEIDFKFQTMSHYIIPISDRMRNFLREQASGSFQGMLDVVIKTTNPEPMPFQFTLDDMQ